MADERARVLCVCEGNICRSPAMELYLTRAWRDDAHVNSAGTYAMVGWEVPAPMFAVLKAEHLDASAHEPAQLDAAAINAATMLLVAGVEQRNWAVKVVPEAASKAFMLTEAAALTKFAGPAVGGDRAARLLAAPHILDAARGSLASQRHADILDPYGLGPAQHVEAMQQMREALETLLAWIDG